MPTSCALVMITSAPAKRACSASVRIDDDAAIRLVRGCDQLRGNAFAQHALPVIGQQYHRRCRHRVPGHPQQALDKLGVHGVRVLAVGAQQMVALQGPALRNEARLDGGDAAALDQQPRLEPRLTADQSGKFGASRVVADHRDECDRRAERAKVAHDVARAPGHRQLPLNGQHGHRCLGADAGDLAVDVAVEHSIADHQHARRARGDG